MKRPRSSQFGTIAHFETLASRSLFIPAAIRWQVGEVSQLLDHVSLDLCRFAWPTASAASGVSRSEA